MAHISFSELQNWVTCPMYHKITYIDKTFKFEGNLHTAFGLKDFPILKRWIKICLNKCSHREPS